MSAPSWPCPGGFVAFPKTMTGVGKRCIFRGRHSTKDIFIRAVRRSRRWFPEKGYILEPQIFRFAAMILRDRCSTLYDLASLFRGRRSTLDRWTGKIAKTHWYEAAALHSTFHFWRKSRRILSFLMLSTSKNEEGSQNSFVFDVVKFKHWGSLAELLRFWQHKVLMRNEGLPRTNHPSESIVNTMVCTKNELPKFTYRHVQFPTRWDV